MKRPIKNSKHCAGFTLIELIATLGIVGVIMLIGLPNFAAIDGQMMAAQDVRQLAMSLADLRAEAMRLRANVSITFNSDGYSWDIFDDGASDGSVSLHEHSSWHGSTPGELVFNGLGLLRGIVSTQEISVINRSVRGGSLTLNRNGFIKL